MIYLFTGSDSEKARSKAFAWVRAAREKEPSVVYTRLAREELSPTVLEELSSGSGLFVARQLVLLDDPFSQSGDFVNPQQEGGFTKSGNPIEDCLDLLEASNNVFVLLAPRILASRVKKIEVRAKKVYTFDQVQEKETRGFNSALVNALGSRSREKLWLETVRALKAGDAPEMVHGLLHWKARDLMEKGGRAWSPSEARTLSLSLITLLQNSRRAGLPLPLALEKFALSL